MADARLVDVGVAAAVVDRAEHRVGLVGVHEGAGAVVDGLAGDRAVVGVHDAVDEAHQHPLGHQVGLARDHAIEQGAIRVLLVARIGIVAGDDMVGQQAQRLAIAARSEELEGADADVAGRDARQHRARQHGLAHHRLAGGDRRERARGRDAERRHRLADDVFAQHRTQRRTAIAAARERRGPRTLELDVAPHARAIDHLAQQDGAAIAELRHEVAELVAGIGERDRLGAGGEAVAGQDLDGLRRRQHVGIEAELAGQRLVDLDQARAPRPASDRGGHRSARAAAHSCCRSQKPARRRTAAPRAEGQTRVVRHGSLSLTRSSPRRERG